MSDEAIKESFIDMGFILDTFTHEEISKAIEADEVKLFNTLYQEKYGYELNTAQLFFLAGLNEKGLEHYRNKLNL
ncbi:hypothetical protein P4H71_06920 [Paenibacillus kribbensis]|uniref:hypothetical protein n=1 Tax=Paenibacillus kribbensis TaxID=172713 RepID=UPI002DB83A8E|nr:hypothetical protein [Paenibacillus kribbensis]MEC0234062.1 hypothetical protein [Paenibacillus kribbensis]